jgi:hypothetical protein
VLTGTITMGNTESRQKAILMEFGESCLSENTGIVDCADVLEAMDAQRRSDITMARWTLPLVRGETREIPTHGTALLGFRSTGQDSGTVHVAIGSHVNYALTIPAGGRLVPALFGTSALPIGALPRERIVVTAPPTADVEAVYAFLPGDSYELNYEAAYEPWTLHTPSGLVMLAANGKLWPLADVPTLPASYPSTAA